MNEDRKKRHEFPLPPLTTDAELNEAGAGAGAVRGKMSISRERKGLDPGRGKYIENGGEHDRDNVGTNADSSTSYAWDLDAAGTANLLEQLSHHP